MKGGSPETGLAPRRSERRQKTTAAARWAADIVCQHGHVRKVPTGAGFPLAKNTEWEAKAEAGRMTAIRAITYVDGAGARPGRM